MSGRFSHWLDAPPKTLAEQKAARLLEGKRGVARRPGLLGLRSRQKHFAALAEQYGGEASAGVRLGAAWQRAAGEPDAPIYTALAAIDPGTLAETTVEGAIAKFDAVITSRRRDRDGDVLEPAGAVIDPACPLLWQHLAEQPVGKLVKVTRHDDHALAGRFAIADTQLGADCVALIEMGALRVSHGFQPIEFGPLNDSQDDRLAGTGGTGGQAHGIYGGRAAGDSYLLDDDDQQGFHITAYEILEVSLVSIPSNTDAVITAFSRGKLHSPLVKSWAGQLARRSRN